VDIEKRRIHCYHPGDDATRTYTLAQRIGSLVRRERGGLLLALENGFWRFDPETEALEHLHDPEPDRPGNRFNDGKCDARGRFWAGTMDAAQEVADAGSLYCLDTDGRVERHLGSVGISNGLAWSADGRRMYYIDSPTRRVDVFDYDLDAARFANRRTAFEIPEGLGFPDGMSIDVEGKLWVAIWGGSMVARFDPDTGAMLAQVPVPAAHVTSCAFAGPALDELYITTARQGLDENALAAQPTAGGLFRARVPVPGLPAEPYRG
jgi:sugar lactone lactonase YvrE